MEPNPTYLRQRDDLTRFKDAYQVALRTIARECGHCDAIHLFPGVPSPVAVFCGREILPKVDPKLVVYDYDKRLGGFTPRAISVSPRGIRCCDARGLGLCRFGLGNRKE
jgi:hypothetical protein